MKKVRLSTNVGQDHVMNTKTEAYTPSLGGSTYPISSLSSKDVLNFKNSDKETPISGSKNPIKSSSSKEALNEINQRKKSLLSKDSTNLKNSEKETLCSLPKTVDYVQQNQNIEGKQEAKLQTSAHTSMLSMMRNNTEEMEIYNKICKLLGHEPRDLRIPEVSVITPMNMFMITETIPNIGIEDKDQTDWINEVWSESNFASCISAEKNLLVQQWKDLEWRERPEKNTWFHDSERIRKLFEAKIINASAEELVTLRNQMLNSMVYSLVKMRMDCRISLESTEMRKKDLEDEIDKKRTDFEEEERSWERSRNLYRYNMIRNHDDPYGDPQGSDGSESDNSDDSDYSRGRNSKANYDSDYDRHDNHGYDHDDNYYSDSEDSDGNYHSRPWGRRDKPMRREENTPDRPMRREENTPININLLNIPPPEIKGAALWRDSDRKRSGWKDLKDYLVKMDNQSNVSLNRYHYIDEQANKWFNVQFSMAKPPHKDDAHKEWSNKKFFKLLKELIAPWGKQRASSIQSFRDMKPYIKWSEHDSGMEFQSQIDEILDDEDIEQMSWIERKELIEIFLNKIDEAYGSHHENVIYVKELRILTEKDRDRTFRALYQNACHAHKMYWHVKKSLKGTKDSNDRGNKREGDYDRRRKREPSDDRSNKRYKDNQDKSWKTECWICGNVHHLRNTKGERVKCMNRKHPDANTQQGTHWKDSKVAKLWKDGPLKTDSLIHSKRADGSDYERPKKATDDRHDRDDSRDRGNRYKKNDNSRGNYKKGGTCHTIESSDLSILEDEPSD